MLHAKSQEHYQQMTLISCPTILGSNPHTPLPRIEFEHQQFSQYIQADQEVRMLNEAVRVTISSMYLFSSESQPEYGKSFIRKVCSVKPDLDSNTGSIDFMPFDISNIKTRKKKEL